MNEGIKVGDIVYWHSDYKYIREHVYRHYPYIKEGYGVVQRARTGILAVSFPSVGGTIELWRSSCHKVEME